MTKKIFFTPGPSALYYTLEEHIKSALKEQVMEINHRSKQAEAYYQSAVEGLKSLMSIPEDYQVFFLSSATEIWERQLQNLAIQHTFHFTNGAFSQRFFDFAQAWGFDAKQAQAEYGSLTAFVPGMIPEETELITLALNETSTGVAFPLEQVYAIKKAHPKALLAVDGVSAFPVVDLDFSRVDSAYFSVQKCFGLPAGLGVWIVSPRAMAKAEEKQAAGHSIGSYQSLPNLHKNGIKNQTTYTANVMNIFLLAKVCEDMLEKGISAIRSESNYKRAVIHHAITEHTCLSHFVKDEKLRSPTISVATVEGATSHHFINALSAKGLVMGNGYGAFKGQQLRIANFPTHSKEQFEQLADFLKAVEIA